MPFWRKNPSQKKIPVDPEYTTPPDQTRQLIYGTWRRLHGSWVHLPALMMTAVILWVNHDQIWWFDQSGHNGLSQMSRSSLNNILNSLQLLAKVYEIAVVASLAHITIKAYKRRLVGDGLPAGVLTAGYRVGDLLYLLGPHFRRAKGGPWLLAAMLIVNTLLAVLVGPASAILIIPELGWYRVRQPFLFRSMPVFMDRSETHWPEVLDERSVANVTDCSTEQANFKIGCPGAGFESLYTWASSWAMAGLSDSILFPDHSGRTSRRLEIYTDHVSNAGTFATTPMSVVASTLGQLQARSQHEFSGHISVLNDYKLELAEDRSSRFYQPLVNSKCFVWNSLDSGYEDNLSAGDDPRLDSESYLSCDSATDDDSCNRTRRHLVDKMKQQRLPAKDSIPEMAYNFSARASEDHNDALPFTTPMFTARLPCTTNINGKTEAAHRFVVCGAIAHWIPVSFGVTNNTNVVMTNITDLADFAKQDGGLVDRMIHIDDSWMKYIDPALNTSDSGNNDERLQTDGSIAVSSRSTRLGLLLGAFLSNNNISERHPFTYVEYGSGNDTSEGNPDRMVETLFEKFITAVLADAISRTHAVIEPMWYPPTTNPVSAGTVEHINLNRMPPREYPKHFGFDEVATARILEDRIRLNQETEVFLQEQRDTYVMLDFDGYRYGYGFGNGTGESGETFAFAMVVVYAYLVVLFSYTLVVTLQRNVAIDAWWDVQDLLALAWSSSSPEEIAEQGSGVRRKAFWCETVTVWASASGAVRMGKSEDQDGAKLEKGEKYL
ncbi:hypothetical protein F5X68DRAFT_218275 [Plectosphaerella plurivora]|uniref:Uncharacterized protein n=1 Tax=Plectosphaerella plurivora TaxID=936078 RepID=A0A9P9A3I9_9PEZI|nr:hypothetical protein F5X68DRAFT_218275 [Plectosphaerella plurivora]